MSKNIELERAVIEVAGGCNYSCQMCPQQDNGRGAEFTKLMPLSLFEDILDQITPKYGYPVINLEGSGEPTLAKKLPEYINAVTKRNCKSFVYTNGSFLTGNFMQECIDAGLDFVRFSCIGYNETQYKKWMNKDWFYKIRDNALETSEYIKQSKSNCIVSSYHLILDNNQIEYEIEQYKKNFVDVIDCVGYIWKMHNWSGNYQPIYIRNAKDRKTCGRPFAPEVTIRAGGIKKHHGAMTPCCQTMGPPNEKKSVLGHLDEHSFEEVFWGDAYEDLRQAHLDNDFDRIEYCKNCDFLYEDPEVLVWSNDPNSSTDYMLGTNFSLKDFKDKQHED